MAHAARVSELADGLVQSILHVNTGDPVIAQTRPAVAKGLRDSSHGRTNQFQVKSRLDGLVEKFAVLNRDDLSETLQERLEELPSGGKWLPEILALFLTLSDRPVEKTEPDALKSLYAAEHPDEQLTWEDIIADDPLDEPGLWDDVERGYHSSGDETRFDDDNLGSEPTTSTRATTIHDDSPETVARSLVTRPKLEDFDFAKYSRWAKNLSSEDQMLRVAELAIVRESLFMLRGLPTNLYNLEPVTGQIQPRSGTAVTTTSRPVIKDALAHFSTIGCGLQRVRRWVRNTQPRPYFRTCQAVVEQLLVELGASLAILEERYVGSDINTVVSMIEVLSETQQLTRHLCQFASLIVHLLSDSPFAILDGLYDYVCTAQLSGDDEGFDVLSSILFQGTETYLRPVATWISSGTIAGGHDDFFVAESGVACEPGDVWHSRFAMRQSNDGAPSMPRFMHDYAAEVFALGKAKMFLDKLTQGSIDQDQATYTSHGPDFGALSHEVQANHLMPFSELFEDTLSNWIKSISTDVMPTLTRLLLEQHGLLNTLSATSSVYLSANGNLFRDFADSLSRRIRRSPSSWSNNFLLTELARETLGETPSVDAESLTIKTDGSPRTTKVVQALQSIDAIYHIPWPLQNITRETHPRTHAKAFVLLLQVSHASRALEYQKFSLRPHHSTTLTPTFSLALRLRQALIVFTSTLYAHITSVASAIHKEIHAALLSATDIDAMVAAYAAHKSRLETSLLLSEKLKPIREAIVSALELCEKFEPLWDGVTQENGDSQMALRSLQRDFASTLGFVTAGVRNVSRVGGETLLENLAERLESMSAR